MAKFGVATVLGTTISRAAISGTTVIFATVPAATFNDFGGLSAQ
jgi:hypothetical protein